MSNPKLIVYSQQLADCPCFHTVFNSIFDTEPAETMEQLRSRIVDVNPDAADVLTFNIVRIFTGPAGGFLATLLLPNVPAINVAPGSPLEGYYGFQP